MSALVNMVKLRYSRDGGARERDSYRCALNRTEL